MKKTTFQALLLLFFGTYIASSTQAQSKTHNPHHLVLEVQAVEAMKSLATHTDAQLETALEETKMLRYMRSGSWGTLLLETMEKSGAPKLATYFTAKENDSESSLINSNSSNEEVAKWLDQNITKEVQKHLLAIRQKLDDGGMKGYKSFSDEENARIYLELPLTKDQETVKQALRFHDDADKDLLTEIRIIGEAFYNESGLMFDPYPEEREEWDEREQISLKSGLALRANDGTIYLLEGSEKWNWDMPVGTTLIARGADIEKLAMSKDAIKEEGDNWTQGATPKGFVAVLKEAMVIESRKSNDQ